jgi:hypothetical protein
MMALVADTGNGMTLTLTTQTAASALKIDKIAIGEVMLDMLDASVLATVTVQELIASDLYKPNKMVVDFNWNQAGTAITITALVDTATVTFPVGPAQTTTTAATFAGTGVVTKIKYPDAANGSLMKGQIEFSFDGDTGPTYTRGA